MTYLYETHLHTSEASTCAKSSGSDYITYYKNLGYDGIFVTDHFFNGNSCIPKDLPWEERITLFCKGYEKAKTEGDRQGLKVFLGWEVNFNHDEYLVYGLDKQWLLAHPDMLAWDQKTHYEKVKEAGGLVVQAHPFRERDYISQVNLHPYQCDAWEVANAGNPHEQDILAYRYAKQYQLPMTAGSDIHDASNAVNEKLYAMAFDQPIQTDADYVRAVKQGLGYQMKLPQAYLESQEEATNHLPAYLYDGENMPSLI
ncbi:MAG: PHP domain-containing protein [Eubacteriales bacterium]|nr:PHP domain-containing protein [Eubacteriales bacterium]